MDSEKPAHTADLKPETLDRYFRSGVMSPHKVSDSPYIQLTLDPPHQAMWILTPARGPLPDTSAMRNVEVEQLDLEDGPHYRLTVEAGGMLVEAYGFLMSVVQAIRGGASFATATISALTNLKSLLANRAKLSEEQQIGLVGELLLVSNLLDEHDEADVVEWWLGPLAEQHDFAFPTLDAEVKTTLADARRHRISGVGQLEPNPGRDLWLVSIQITRAGGADGFSLTGLVSKLKERLVVARDRFIQHLTRVGWHDDAADLYYARYLLRSTPQAYLVDEDFPAVTSGRLRASVPHAELVSDLVYRVDLTTRTPADPGFPLASFLQIKDVPNE